MPTNTYGRDFSDIRFGSALQEIDTENEEVDTTSSDDETGETGKTDGESQTDTSKGEQEDLNTRLREQRSIEVDEEEDETGEGEDGDEDEDQDGESDKEDKTQKKDSSPQGKPQDDNGETDEDEYEIDYKKLASQLADDGIVDPDDIEDDITEDNFKDLIGKKINKSVEDYKSALKESSRNLVEHLENGGKVEDFIEQTKDATYVDYEESGLNDSVDEQKRIIREANKRRGLSDKRIERLVDASEEDETLLEDAKEELKYLKDNDQEKVKEVAEKTKEQKKKKDEKANETVNNIKAQIKEMKDFMGFKVSSKERERIEQKVFDRSSMNKLQKDPAKTELLIATLDEMGILDEDPKKLKRKLESEVISSTPSKGIAKRKTSKGRKSNSSDELNYEPDPRKAFSKIKRS